MCTPSTTCFLGPTGIHILNGISIGSAVVVQLTAESLYFTMGCPFSPQTCPFARGIWTPSNTGFLGPNQVHNPNSISIGSAIFVRLTLVTN